ncbi:aspartate-semialdehyde dehydrogenase [Sphingomonas sp. ERG5]|uniref:aspartate-semialdehyde dehydrogenase n=1 Tax=Sphingomonas sp. ERG5 TaxID=1381597 RepID=UPI00068DFC10|nr:aspartate-semialdehyde dehydrogenase [Sphingomonas sp. ERG5]
MPNELPNSTLVQPVADSVGVPVIAIVGATGAVGIELMHCLEKRDFPVGSLRLLASARSAGRSLAYGIHAVQVEELRDDSFAGVDVALFSAGASISRRYAPIAVAAGAMVVDNSSAFRMDADVPLVVPEVNGATLAGHRGIVANPNCVAAIMTMALAPLHRAVPIRRVHAATYQSASGAGAAAMEELRQATAAHLDGLPFEHKVLPHPYAFNLFSHNADVDGESGYNGEELKAVAETRRILDTPDLPIGITCVRVPVLRAHSIALSVEFERQVSPDEARAWLAAAPGVRVVDDRAANHFPMPSEASGVDDVLVGRIRTDLGDPSGRSIALFVSGDQLLKGAALNAVQILERLLGR